MGTETLTTASGSPWSTPAGAYNLIVECWGGGGAGGGNSTSNDGGGGAGGGAYAKKLIASPDSSYVFTVGTGGTASAGNDGGNGNDTSFGSPAVCLAKGGVGGKAPVGGAGGVAGSGGLASECTGDTGAKWDGGWGTTGRDSSTGRGGGGASSAGTAADGANDGSAGDYATYTMTGRTGPTGSGPGGDGGGAGAAGSKPSGNGGGGGGSGDTSGSALAGGGGADGKIVLTWNVHLTKTLTDSGAANWSDAPKVSKRHLVVATDTNAAGWSDAIAFLRGHLASLTDTASAYWLDDLDVYLEELAGAPTPIEVELEESGSANWNDALGPLLAHRALIADLHDAWADALVKKVMALRIRWRDALSAQLGEAGGVTPITAELSDAFAAYLDALAALKAHRARLEDDLNA